MKNVCKSRQCITLLAITAALLLSGCGSGIRIVDVETGKYKQISRGTGLREVVAGVDTRNNVFFTFVGEGTGAKGSENYLLRKTIDFDGNVIDIKRKPIDPRLLSGGWRLYYSDRSQVALSPNGDRLVYYDEKSDWLNCYNFMTREDRKITNGIKRRRTCLTSLNFINQNELLVFVWEYDKDRDEKNLAANNEVAAWKICKVNLDTGKISEWYKAVYLDDEKPRYAEGKIAFWEGNSAHALYGCIKIMDVNTGTVIHSINEGDRLFKDFNFNHDGSKIVYAVDNQQKIYDLATGQSKLIGTFDKEQSSYYVAFLDDDRIIYHMNPEVGSGLFIRNIHTGVVEKKIWVDVDNDFYAVDGGKKIIVPVY